MAENIRKYIWFEFIIWLIILCFIVIGVRIHRYKDTKKLVTYQIFLPDVDGLIKGSPVKLMGVQIGYIDKIKIVANEVYLKLVITDKNTVLPKGAVATVEFNGMGGSKSLEIYPPTSQSIASGKIIAVQNPVRLNDSLALLGDMYNKLDSIILRMSFFAKETGVIDIKNGIDMNGIENNVDMTDKIIKQFNKEETKSDNNSS